MEAKFKDLNKIILYKMDKDEETTSNLFADNLDFKDVKVTKFFDNKGNCNNLLIELVDKIPPKTIEISENGEYDVSDYKTAKVEVVNEEEILPLDDDQPNE